MPGRDSSMSGQPGTWVRAQFQFRLVPRAISLGSRFMLWCLRAASYAASVAELTAAGVMPSAEHQVMNPIRPARRCLPRHSCSSIQADVSAFWPSLRGR